MLKGTSLDTYNIKSGTVNNAIIQLGDIDDTGKGKHFTSRFIQAGLVKIEGHGIVLLKKETLDMSLQSMVGAPVIIKHQDVTDENADELRCGVISKAYFNDFDGWYYAEGIIWDTKAQELINNKDWSVSCSYDFLSYNDEGGVENNIKYDKEFTSLNFTHLALVNNPRYERANIVFNSKLIDNARGFDGSEGQWVTIKGTHVFIPDGKTLDDVLEAKGWSKKSDAKDSRGDLGEDNPRHIYGKRTDTSIPVATKETNYPSWTKVEVLKEFDDENSALDYAEERGEKVKSDYLNKTKEAEKYGLVSWIEPEDLKYIKEHGYYPEKDTDTEDKQEKTRAKNREKLEKVGKEVKSQIEKIYGDDKDLMEYFSVDTDVKENYFDDGSDMQYIEVRGELSYDEMTKLASKLDKVIQKYDKDAYFDQETGGIMSASINFDRNKKIKNDKEKEMSLIDEIKKLIRKVENNKETEEMIENEKTDKRKLIDEVAGIMKSAGCDDEDIRTAIGKMEKIGYDASEDSKADNKKVKNEDEEDKKEDKKEDKEVDNEDTEDKKEAEDLEEDEKEDVKNKCKNDKSSFEKINEIYNSVKTLKEKTEYETRDEKLKNAEEYFG